MHRHHPSARASHALGERSRPASNQIRKPRNPETGERDGVRCGRSAHRPALDGYRGAMADPRSTRPRVLIFVVVGIVVVLAVLLLVGVLQGDGTSTDPQPGEVVTLFLR